MIPEIIRGGGGGVFPKDSLGPLNSNKSLDRIGLQLNKSKKTHFHWIYPSRDAQLQNYIQTANVSSSTINAG